MICVLLFIDKTVNIWFYTIGLFLPCWSFAVLDTAVRERVIVGDCSEWVTVCVFVSFEYVLFFLSFCCCCGS